VFKGRYSNERLFYCPFHFEVITKGKPMSDIVTLAGSPSHPSRSSAVLEIIRDRFEARQFTTESIYVRNLPAEALLSGRADDLHIQEAIQSIQDAYVVVVATPVYKAAYTGLLKVFLDLLPQQILTDKIVFPIATGGSQAHLLAIDYALKPVLSALGAQHVLNGLYIQDSQLQYTDGLTLDPAIEQRLDKTIHALTHHLIHSQSIAAPVAVGK
jgi:FMN reductase